MMRPGKKGKEEGGGKKEEKQGRRTSSQDQFEEKDGKLSEKLYGIFPHPPAAVTFTKASPYRLSPESDSVCVHAYEAKYSPPSVSTLFLEIRSFTETRALIG